MKTLVTTIVLTIVTALSAMAQTLQPMKENPVIWADMPDPDVIRVDDTYYFMSTTMFYMPGAPIMKSKDLVNWEIAGYVFDKLTDSPRYNLQEGTTYGRGQWATSLRFHDGRFYALFCANEYGDMGRTYIYSAPKASGPWTVVSRLPHFHDASLLFDDDGRVYVFYGTGEQVELTPDLQGVVKGSHRQMFKRDAEETGLLEGSRLVKHRGRYYLLMISHVYKPGRHRREVCYRADNLAGPWEKRVILESDLNNFGYVGQGTIFDTPDGDWYAMIFQDRTAVGRVPILMPCRWRDGWPMLGDEDGRIPKKMQPIVSGQPSCPIVVSDDFDSELINPHWQWNHNPVENAWSLSERKGWLRLKTSRVVNNLYLAPNTITQRMQGPMCSGTVRLDISHLKDGDCAGFCTFNGKSGVLTVKKEGKRLELRMSEQQVNLKGSELSVESVDEEIKESIDLTTLLKSMHTNILYLRIDADFTLGRDMATFHYSTDGSNWKQMGNDFKMQFDWQRLFVGTRFALFCYSTKKTGGYADFDSFSFLGKEI